MLASSQERQERREAAPDTETAAHAGQPPVAATAELLPREQEAVACDRVTRQREVEVVQGAVSSRRLEESSQGQAEHEAPGPAAAALPRQGGKGSSVCTAS